ncbi:hypothetical protein P5G49_06015 [Sporosarcina sp. F6_3S_P_2]|uniref:Uncharacterized protein n=1 Tax=Sporosarcina highlanderae TaxID=3035916 RepID=A0ABT8JPN6_9BACL|nr:hypothetical protein [Sporosarcina highlanderae]MDN4607035.1 hypothetical protein [Sporosarcina highlanderae]
MFQNYKLGGWKILGLEVPAGGLGVPIGAFCRPAVEAAVAAPAAPADPEEGNDWNPLYNLHMAGRFWNIGAIC